MIPRLLAGMAKVLFGLGVVVCTCGLLLVYAAYRLLRRAFSTASPSPRRDALLALIVAAEGLRRALAAPGPVEPAERERPAEPELALAFSDPRDDPREPLIPY